MLRLKFLLLRVGLWLDEYEIKTKDLVILALMMVVCILGIITIWKH
jgi:hypothetical protein